MTEIDENYDKLRQILSPSISVELPKHEAVERLVKNMFTEEEAFIIVKGFKKANRPRTIGIISRRTGIPKENLKEILKDMAYKGKIINRAGIYIVLQFLPGGFELYFIHNCDEEKNLKETAEAYRDFFHVRHANNSKKIYPIPLFRVIPAIDPTLKTLKIDESIEVKHQILPFEVLEKTLSPKKKYVVLDCCCRTAAELAGNPCKATTEPFCVGVGTLATEALNYGIGRQVSLDELMELMRKAEKAGLVHETTNLNKSTMLLCNCCTCCCGFLKSVKYTQNVSSVAISNFDPIISEEKCDLCQICIKKCPMEAITLNENKLEIKRNICLGCGVCASNCPLEAINLKKVRENKPKGLIGFGLKFLLGKSQIIHF
ncbi:MAG: hypothetical protein GY870_05885 [archaeon]|nr:hypothetical protein [archaeon]